MTNSLSESRVACKAPQAFIRLCFVMPSKFDYLSMKNQKKNLKFRNTLLLGSCHIPQASSVADIFLQPNTIRRIEFVMVIIVKNGHDNLNLNPD